MRNKEYIQKEMKTDKPKYVCRTNDNEGNHTQRERDQERETERYLHRQTQKWRKKKDSK